MSANISKSLVFVISGPSGSGKTTLADMLVKDKALKGKLVKSVSFTTRPRRSSEQEGREYFFVSEPKLQQLRRQKKILEWTKYLGYYYATPRDFVAKHLRIGKSVILCLDLKGALEIKRFYPDNTVTIFVNPPSLVELRERIKGRCSKTREAEVRQRLRLAKKEILNTQRYDYSVDNKRLSWAIRKIKAIVLQETRR